MTTSMAEMTEVPTAELTTSMILTRAKEILNAMGWCKDTYEDKHGRFCIMGAIGKAAGGTYLAYAANWEVRKIVGPNMYNLSGWNDDPCTTYADVVKVLDQAIKATTPKEEINGN